MRIGGGGGVDMRSQNHLVKGLAPQDQGGGEQVTTLSLSQLYLGHS